MEVVYKMNWNQSTVFKFIDLYRKNSCLWDPQHEEHKHRLKLREAWERIQKELGMPCTLNELKKKKESLMSAYRAYTTKIKRCELEGKAWEPTWTYYETLDSFLGSVYTCNISLQTEESRAEDASQGEETDEDEYCNKDDDEGATEVKSLKNKKALSLTIRRRQYAPEQRLRNQQIDDTVSYTKPVDNLVTYSKQEETSNFTKPVTRPIEENDDECSTYGLLIAKKLRKLSDDRRDVMMVKINQLFVDEHNERNLARRPHSTSMFRDVSSPSTSHNDPLLVEVKSINQYHT